MFLALLSAYFWGRYKGKAVDIDGDFSAISTRDNFVLLKLKTRACGAGNWLQGVLCPAQLFFPPVGGPILVASDRVYTKKEYQI